MEEKRNFSRYCVYTIRDTDKLKETYGKGGNDTFEENGKWVEGKNLLRESQKNKEQMPVLFAAAEEDSGLLYYAILGAVEVDPDASKTKYSFTELTPLSKEPPKSSLIKKSDNKPLSESVISPYRMCFTPDL